MAARRTPRGTGAHRSTKPTTARTNPPAALRNPQLLEFPKSLPMMLMRGREAVMRYFRPSLREHGLTEQQWRVLRALAHYGPLEASELARVTILLPPSLSRILRDLSARRLVNRTTVKTDLRRSVIRMSPTGLSLMREVAPHSQIGNREISRRYGRRRLELLQKMLSELEASLLRGPQAGTSFPAKGARAGRRARRGLNGRSGVNGRNQLQFPEDTEDSGA
jgi:homoprotocatechuate degradation regulator HpaR